MEVLFIMVFKKKKCAVKKTKFVCEKVTAVCPPKKPGKRKKHAIVKKIVRVKRLAPQINVPQGPAPVVNVPPCPPQQITVQPAPVTVVQDECVAALEAALRPFLNNLSGVELFTAQSESQQPQGVRTGILREIRPGGVIVLEPANAEENERLFYSLCQVIGFTFPGFPNSQV
jgi:hypothetical protein